MHLASPLRMSLLLIGDRVKDSTCRPSSTSITVTGSFQNFNTIEAFKAADKTVIFNREADKVTMD